MSIGLDYQPLSGFNPYDNPALKTDPRLAPGGIVEGLGNLASALITTPQKVAQIKLEQQRMQNESDYRKSMMGYNMLRGQALQTPEDRMAREKLIQDAADKRAQAQIEAANQRANQAQNATASLQSDRLSAMYGGVNGPGKAVTPNIAVQEAARRAQFEVGDPNYVIATDPATGEPKKMPRTAADRAAMMPQYQAAMAKHLQDMGYDPNTLQRIPMNRQAGAPPPAAPPQPQRPPMPPGGPGAPQAGMPPGAPQPQARPPMAPAGPPANQQQPNPIAAGLSQMSPGDQQAYQRIVATGDPGRIDAAHSRIMAAYAPRPPGAPLGPDSTLGPPTGQPPLQPTPQQPPGP